MGQAQVADVAPEIDLPMVNFFLAEFVKWFHVAIFLFTSIGWAFPWRQSWALLIILVPIMKLHWMTNNGNCIFTTLENKLRRNPKAGTDQQAGFMYRISLAILGKYSPPQDKVNILMEIGMYLGWFVAIYRYFSF